jgi:DNA-binding MarR family transcriptional regulator
MANGDTVDLAGLDRQVGFALRLAQVAVFKDLTACLKPLALRPADFSALLIIEANLGLKQQAIGEALAIQGPNLATLIDQLAQRGLVARGPAPADRRAYALHLTPDGKRLLAAAKRAHERHLARMDERLAGADKGALIALLRRLAAF